MKITVNNIQQDRKIVAVLYRNGIYRMHNGELVRHDIIDNSSRTEYNSFEDLMRDMGKFAQPLYEGDSITIEF